MNDREQDNEKRETVADVVAEMKRTKYGDEDCSVKWCLREWAARIESAWKREKDDLVYAYDPTKAGNGRLPEGSAYALEAMREPVKEHPPVGNAAAMRESLENSNGLLEELAAIGEWGESAREQIAENNAALSAPARNCDLYDNWYDAHKAWRRLPKDELGYFVAANGVHECERAWLFAPAERKGEGDA